MFRLLKRYIKGYVGFITANVAIVVLQLVLQLTLLAREMKIIIDKGVSEGSMDVIISSGTKMIIFTVVAGLCTIFTSYLSARITAGITCDIRDACYKKVVKMSPQEFGSFGESTLLTRTVADVTQMQILIINFMRTSLMVPVIILVLSVSIFSINKVIFAIMISAFVLTILFIAWTVGSSKSLFNELQVQRDRLNLLVKEKITGVRTIRGFGNQKYEEEKLNAANDDVYQASIMANKKINFLSPMSMIIMNWAVVFIYLVSGSQIKAGLASVSDLLVVFQYLAYFIASLAVVPVLVNMIPKVIVSSARINELLDSRDDDIMAVAKPFACNGGKIEFRNVSFGYSKNDKTLQKIDFTIKPGSKTAVIGATGSGKTTIMNLLMGFYSPVSGEILVDEQKLSEVDLDSYRQHISYASQNAYVFQDTALNNITMYDSTITEQKVKEACEAACFSEVIEIMPDGINTVMAQAGKNISGGQRQRMSLARTVVKDADIYIFDDTFSALDATTERRVRTNISKMLAGKTVVMVAQKINTIRDADQIIVLDKGCIVGKGTHDELMNTCEEYREIYETQNYLEKEEA